MIWVRLALATSLACILIVFLFITIVSIRIESTFLSHKFYLDVLQRNQIYNFVSSEIPYTVLEDSEQINTDVFMIDDIPWLLASLDSEDIVASFSRVFPPDALQSSVEEIFTQIIPYITNRDDKFIVVLDFNQEFFTLTDEIKIVLSQTETQKLLKDKYLDPIADDLVKTGLPFDIKVSSKQVRSFLDRVFPPEWVNQQVHNSIDELVRYLIGREDSFQLSIELQDRVEIIVNETEVLLRETEVYPLLYYEILLPTLTEISDQKLDLKFGLSITENEILDLIREGVSEKWMQRQSELVIYSLSPYLIGQTDTIDLVIDISSQKPEIRNGIKALILARLRDQIELIPQCDLDRKPLYSPEGLPDCIPVDLMTSEIMRDLETDVINVTEFVLNSVPDELHFHEGLIQNRVGFTGENNDRNEIDKFRKLIKEGWIYTDQDLRHNLIHGFFGIDAYRNVNGENSVVKLDEFRSLMSEGWIYTHKKLRKDIVDLFGREGLDSFDRWRYLSELFRSLKYFLYAIVILLMVVIGFIGGRSWHARLLWGTGPLFFGAISIYFITSIIYSIFLLPELSKINDTIANEVLPGRLQITEQLIASKISELIDLSVTEFLSGLMSYSLIVSLFSLLAIICILIGMFLTGRRATDSI